MSHLQHLLSGQRSATAASSAPAAKVPLTEAAASLPEHIRLATDPGKLNAQTPFFVCPDWAGLPPVPHHFTCTREGEACAAVDLSRFPYYLIGRHEVCDYVLAHSSISSVHAAVVYHHERECFVVIDLKSTNGTRLNGQRIPRQELVVLVEGSTLQFGYSSRRYELKAGRCPHKRVREPTPPSSTSGLLSGSQMTGKDQQDCEAAPAPEPAAAAVAPAPATEEDIQYHLYQLVLKHKDTSKPVSRGLHTKGKAVTRSRDDAVGMAEFILSNHQRDHEERAREEGSGGFVYWTVEEFIACVDEYNEILTKTHGDLGLVTAKMYDTAFSAAAFALRRREVSGPIHTPLGVHVVFRSD